MSLGEYRATAVLRAESFPRAATFYTEVLGLKRLGSSEGPTTEGMFEAGNGSIVDIYERPNMPPPANTTLGFGVPTSEFEDVVADLRARGVTFEEYDMPDMGLKTVDGIAEFDGTKAAWFKDSEGNILTVGSM
jgi:catechol 2,3-dioxygenase-like lactoylglutathione lyase family enzyme